MSERRRRRAKIIDTQTLACFTRRRRRNRKARLYMHHIICACVCLCNAGDGMCAAAENRRTEVDNLGEFSVCRLIRRIIIICSLFFFTQRQGGP